LDGANAVLTRIVYSPDGEKIVAACQNGKLQLWNVKSKTLVASAKAHDKSATYVSFSPDGKHIASSGGMAIKLWDPD